MISFPELLASFCGWLARASAQACVLIVLVLAAQALLRGKLAPRWRYALWLLVVFRLILPWAPESPISVYNLLLFPRHFAERSSSPAPEMEIIESPLTALTQREKPSAGPHEAGSPATGQGAQPERRSLLSLVPVSLGELLPLVWLVGAVVLAGFVLAQSISLGRAVRQRRFLTDQRVLDVLEECKERMGVSAYLAVVETDRVRSPALFGFIRPRLLLPAGALDALGPDRLRHVFLHELAHLKRRDVPVNWLMTLLQVLHWFNPLVWYAFGRMRADREMACDALALSHARPGESLEYGRTIVQLLENFTQPRRLPSLAGILENQNQMKRRIAMIAQFRKPSGRCYLLAATLVLALSCVALTNPKHKEEGTASSITIANKKEANVDRFLAQRYPLEKALVTRETTGFVFAVHELRQCQGGAYYTVCSMRLTEPMKSAIGPGRAISYYGGFNLVPIYNREGGTEFVLSLIARLHNGDLQVDRLLLIPTGPVPDQISECELQAEINAANKLEEILNSKGSDIHQSLRIRVPVETNRGTLRIADIVENAYSEGIVLEPVVHSFLLADRNRIYEAPAVVWRKPSKTTSAEILKGIEWDIARLANAAESSHIPATSAVNAEGRIVDKTDYPFVNDPAVIGTWKSVDFVAEPEKFKPGQKQRKGDLFLKELVILPNGRTALPWETWTKGMIFHSGDRTASRYDLKELAGSTYMFLECKNGDYTIRHAKPRYDVLKKESSGAGGLAEAWAALPSDEEFRRSFPEKIAQLDIDTVNLDRVIEVLGKPAQILRKYQYLPDPRDYQPPRYVIMYPDGFSILMTNNKILELCYSKPGYFFRGNLQVGSTLEDVLKVVGEPKKTVVGKKVKGNESEFKDTDGVLYKDMDGEKGNCYYERPDQKVRFVFHDNKVYVLCVVSSLYVTLREGKGESPSR